jgi:ABC-type protease/lipase transport system fused ATPase/permease subunit
MQLLFFLDIFLIPTFMASIIIFAPWTAWLRTLLIVVLFGLSLAWHRLTATLQAADMVYFVERALEEMKPAEVFSLGSDAENIITLEREFREQWQEFYEQHKNDSSADHSPA